MDTEELEVSTSRSSRTHHTHLYRLSPLDSPSSSSGIELSGFRGSSRGSKHGSFLMTLLLSPLASQRAVEVMCFVPKRCNDMMTLGRLRGFEVWGWNRKPEDQCSSVSV